MSATGTFPNILRRTTFASFDPSITRVYTSTPHSIYQHGDFGIKYPVHRDTRRQRHIKVSQLDVGRFLGSDWRSAEREAQFVKAYGSGKVPWRTEEESAKAKYNTGSRTLTLWDSEYPSPEEESSSVKELMEDVNSMTCEQFEKYLEKVRKHRKEYLVGKLDHLSPRAANQLTLPEDKTLVNLAQKGHVANPDTGVFQVGLAKAQMEDKGPRKIYSSPHVIHGLSYSRTPITAATHNSTLYHSGRALDRNSGFKTNLRNPGRNENTNKPWTVSLGGATVSTSNQGGTIAEGGHLSESVDYSREQPNRGSAKFRITGAKILSPPTVIDFNKRSAAKKWTNDRKNVPIPFTPLNTFKFDISATNVSDDAVRQIGRIGTKEWVGQDSRSSTTTLNDWDRQLGIGGPRSERRQGEAAQNLKSFDLKRSTELRENRNNSIADILKRLTPKTATK